MKYTKKPISILLSLIVFFSLFTIIPVTTAGALDGVSYIDRKGKPQTANNVTEITSGTTTLTEGWYAVTDEITIDSISLDGEINLILCDGAKLTVPGGIKKNHLYVIVAYLRSDRGHRRLVGGR